VPYPVANQAGVTALLYTRDSAGALVPWGLNSGEYLASASGAD
jgi:hypothetical protein